MTTTNATANFHCGNTKTINGFVDLLLANMLFPVIKCLTSRSARKFLASALATWLSVMPLQRCLGADDNVKPPEAAIQAGQQWTRLDVSRITFNDDISYLSPSEQALYRKCQAEFFESLERLPPRKRREVEALYKLVPDVVKISASRDYQDRKEYIQRFRPKGDLYSSVVGDYLLQKKKHLPESTRYNVFHACRDMLYFGYPLQAIDVRNQSIEDTAKKCGFGYLSKMIDFCNNPNNAGKHYSKSVDNLTYKRTLEELDAFQSVGKLYETEIWLDFRRYAFFPSFKLWRFDLKKVDTSNLTPEEYARTEKLLKCVPPLIFSRCRYPSYDSRTGIRSCQEMLKDTTCIKKYVRDKGFCLSEEEVNEVHQLASELLKYGTLLRLVKRDDQADLGEVAKKHGLYRVRGFCGYYKRKKENNLKGNKFYRGSEDRIPYFISEAKDFYNLGMAVNPEATKKLYRDIESDTGIVIPHSGIQSQTSTCNVTNNQQQSIQIRKPQRLSHH